MPPLRFRSKIAQNPEGVALLNAEQTNEVVLGADVVAFQPLGLALPVNSGLAKKC